MISAGSKANQTHKMVEVRWPSEYIELDIHRYPFRMSNIVYLLIRTIPLTTDSSFTLSSLLCHLHSESKKNSPSNNRFSHRSSWRFEEINTRPRYWAVQISFLITMDAKERHSKVHSILDENEFWSTWTRICTSVEASPLSSPVSMGASHALFAIFFSSPFLIVRSDRRGTIEQMEKRVTRHTSTEKRSVERPEDRSSRRKMNESDDQFQTKYFLSHLDGKIILIDVIFAYCSL